MFKDYQSKPVTRKAHKITGDDFLKPSPNKGKQILVSEGVEQEFAHHEKVNVGDYIVFLNDEDVYHCNAKVFAERNIIED